MFHNNYIGLLAALLCLSLLFYFLKTWNKKLQNKRFDLGVKPTIKKGVRWSFLILALCLLLYMDFLRDYVFHNLSYRMNYLYLIENGGSPDKYMDYTDSLMLKILGDANSSLIYGLKYFFSFIFIIIYFLLTQLIIKLVYPAQNTFPFTSLLYGCGALLAGIVFSGYFFTWSHDVKLNFYLISMEIGHFLESSLPALLCILGFKIYQEYQTPNEIE